MAFGSWLFAATTAFVAGFTWRDLRRARLYRARNDGGQCAHCACRLESWRVRQIGNGRPLHHDHRPVRFDVCLGCHAHYRRRCWLIYLGVPPLSVVALILLSQAIVNKG